MPGAVFSGSLDGHFRAFSPATMAVCCGTWTRRANSTPSTAWRRAAARSTSAVPAIANGLVVTTSGYGQWGGMRGNVLLVFSVDGR